MIEELVNDQGMQPEDVERLEGMGFIGTQRMFQEGYSNTNETDGKGYYKFVKREEGEIVETVWYNPQDHNWYR